MSVTSRARNLFRGPTTVVDLLTRILAAQRTIITQQGQLLAGQRSLLTQMGTLMGLSDQLSQEITDLGAAIDALAAVPVPTDVDDITQGQLDALHAQIARIVALGQAAPEVPTSGGDQTPVDGGQGDGGDTAAPSGDVDPSAPQA